MQPKKAYEPVERVGAAIQHQPTTITTTAMYYNQYRCVSDDVCMCKKGVSECVCVFPAECHIGMNDRRGAKPVSGVHL